MMIINMHIITMRISYLCILNLLILSVMASVSDLTPLCGTMDGSSQKDSDQIIFKQQIRTFEVNGTIYACYSDGTVIDTTSTTSVESTDEKLISEQQLNQRLSENEQKSGQISLITANVSRCAEQNQTYCTKYDNYPIDIIEKLLRKQLYKYADVFGSDMISSEIINRSDAHNEITLCDNYEQVIYPTQGKNQNGIDTYIINTNQYKQGVRVSMCRTTGQPCKLSENFPNGYRTECKQHFVYRELVTLEPNNLITKQKIELPACCSCAVFRDENLK